MLLCHSAWLLESAYCWDERRRLDLHVKRSYYHYCVAPSCITSYLERGLRVRPDRLSRESRCQVKWPRWWWSAILRRTVCTDGDCGVRDKTSQSDEHHGLFSAALQWLARQTGVHTPVRLCGKWSCYIWLQDQTDMVLWPESLKGL